MTCGITVAPRIPTERRSASLLPPKLGVTACFSTWLQSGFANVSSARYETPMTPTKAAITASNGRNPRRCRPRIENAALTASPPAGRRGGDPREDRCGEEGEPRQEMDGDGSAEKLSEIGRHRDQLRLHPEQDRRAPREAVAAHLREVPASRDPELRREGLDEHREQV